MLTWSSTSVRCLRRVFSAAARRFPGRGVGDVEVIPHRRSTLRPPSIVNRSRLPRNSCSFIGQITAPVMMDKYDLDSSFTFLQVKRPSANQTLSPFEICIRMKGELAQVSLAYLRRKQFAYVSGFLYSYEKVNSSDQHDLKYTVLVQQLNFIRTKEALCKTKEDLQNGVALSASTASDPDSCDLSKEERMRDRHILWQIFFTNPYEWWDRRATKRAARVPSKLPDFQHKSTGEALWIRSDDPPWVKKQLSLYDSKMSEFNMFRKKEDGGLRGWELRDFDHW